VLTGSLDRIGVTYVLTTNVVDPSDGRVVTNVTSDVSRPSELLRQVRQQALRVRRLLGEALPTIEQSRLALEKVTTPSLPAVQLYSRAAALLEGEYWRPDSEALKRYPESPSRYASAEALLRQATEVDPTFAAAWMLLGHVLANQNRPHREYRPFVEKAFALAGTVSPVERWMIEGFAWRYRPWQAGYQEVDSSVRAYEATLQLVPDHYWALLELQYLYGVLGRVNDQERVTLHAARLRPHAFRFAIDSARIRLRHGDRDGARSIIRQRAPEGADKSPQLAALPPESLAWFRLWDTHLAWLNGDVRRALEVVHAVDQSWTSNHYLGLYQLANAYQGLGRYGDAERVARRMAPMQTDFFLALIAARRERWDELRAMLHPERREFYLLNFRVGMLVQAGWLEDATWVFEERQRRKYLPAPTAQDDVEGQLRVAQGRYEEGIAQLERLTAGKAGPRFFVDESYAMARRGVGDLPGAIHHLERVGEMRGHAVAHDAWQVTGWLECRVLLAEYYVEAGRASEAARVAEEARGLLAVADADHPLLTRLGRLPGSHR
jgi:tetratricopeptide (TPR) repeat protein